MVATSRKQLEYMSCCNMVCGETTLVRSHKFCLKSEILHIEAKLPKYLNFEFGRLL